MKKPPVTIYGFGYVGKAVWHFLKDHFEIQIYDPAPVGSMPEGAAEALQTKWKDIVPTTYAIICVPTPMLKNGSCDTKAVEKILRESEHSYYLIKSTVTPGTTERLMTETKKRIAFSPEFIGEGNYSVPHWLGFPHPTDMRLHQFFIFGGKPAVTNEWVRTWQKVSGWAPKYIQTTATTAELVKYSINSYLGTVKMFWDQIYDASSAYSVDYQTVRELVTHDKRVSPAMSIIYRDSRGFGGKCLVKDMSALVYDMKKRKTNPHFFTSVLDANQKFKKKKK